jgi:hypothetical protein
MQSTNLISGNRGIYAIGHGETQRCFVDRTGYAQTFKGRIFGVSGNATAIGESGHGGVRSVFSEAGPRCLGRVLLRVNVPFNS